ncbi:hypothetical protein D9758_012455 [Tetrapyrgos nigripes]|uniref:Uncharacterized protein n=1 Tax=Tetrapyrgos nigripes TaxID=182062 RepID=A0A8H5CYI2_9AGAR|nr:hypothetical protein D9758_012455 [Tetrapyrgos nigripes]
MAPPCKAAKAQQASAPPPRQTPPLSTVGQMCAKHKAPSTMDTDMETHKRTCENKRLPKLSLDTFKDIARWLAVSNSPWTLYMAIFCTGAEQDGYIEQGDLGNVPEDEAQW